MLVSVDSPGAFEEMVWLAFWPEHYKRDRILPWQEEEHSVFRDFLENHCKKIVAVSATGDDDRSDCPGTSLRYVSKNNGNIARLPWLVRHFRDALFVIPFRDPVQHCASLRRQHLNFLEIHRRDAFARTYMKGIGHFDFGDNLRPVDFAGWLDISPYRNPLQMDFWLAYWRVAYGSLIDAATERVCFVNYDALCANPRSGLERLANFIDIENTHAFLAQAERIQARSSYGIDCTVRDKTCLEEAQALYARLAALSIV
jgi:hypothetical protein